MSTKSEHDTKFEPRDTIFSLRTEREWVSVLFLKYLSSCFGCPMGQLHKKALKRNVTSHRIDLSNAVFMS